METKGNFYLGRVFDLKKGKTSDDPLLYEPDDLTTHAVVVGMTGSGKTGLCIDLLEEAALNGIPAILIDPKGDITNTLLHFPQLLPQDFKPWINPDQARRAGQTLDQAATETATTWKKGLADWGIDPERIRSLERTAHFAIYTPGSDAGIPVSILASLKAPELPWEGNEEVLREKISGTVTAILGLVGLKDLDPIRSREHILLSNIFEYSWSQGNDLALDELILQTQNPPFQKLGVFDVNTSFPQKDRFELAMMLNNILAAPAFQTWIQGQPLDIPSLLYGPDNRPRHGVFYIAHLSDEERMFFVTLLFSAAEAWMRAQSGTSTLRALIYFDEIFGYLPPVSNPPSKYPMLRMLKQARAFGLGIVLVTQNPVDLDYKGLSNTGTWFIGKLQTDQDKQRLLDGLQGALAGAMDRSAYDKMISGLGKRVFLMHNVHNKEPILYQTRWAMNYLAGPLARNQIPALNQLVGAKLQLAAPSSSSKPSPTLAAQPGMTPILKKQTTPSSQGLREDRQMSGPGKTTVEQQVTAGRKGIMGSVTRPALPTGVEEYFLPNNLTLAEAFKAGGKIAPTGALNKGMIYRPVILAQARIRYLNRTYNLDYEQIQTVLVTNPDRRGVVRWEEYPEAQIDQRQLENRPAPEARFASLEAPMSDYRLMTAIQRDFIDWAFRTGQVNVRANEELKVYFGPEVSQAEIRQACSEAAREGRDAEQKKIEATYDKKIADIQVKQSREQRELSGDQTELSQRRMEEMGTHAENVLGLFIGRRSTRRLSSSMTKHRMAEQAKADVKESEQAIAEFEKQIAALTQEKAEALEEVNQRWGDIANQVSEIPVVALRKDVLIDLFGVAWLPYYLVQTGNQEIELPANDQG
jgi:hypothetical protein